MTQQRSTAGDSSVRSYDVDNKYAVTSPLDSVRWAAVLAGLFTALTAVIVLTVLGIAIGLTSLDAANPRSFGIGAGVYGAISAIVAFALGGYIAARTAAVTGSSNAILNGGLVWIVALPLIVNLLTSGIGSLLGTAANVAGTAASTVAQVAAPLVDDAAQVGATAVAQNPEAAADAAATVESVAADAANAVATQVQTAVEQVDEPEEVEAIADDLGNAAWGTLLALGLTAAAALGGGYLGRRSLPTEVVSVNR